MSDGKSGYFRFDHLDAISEQWQAIAEYNAGIKDRLPQGARTFVLSEWHYNYNDPRCPHDSRIRSIGFEYSGDNPKSCKLILRMLGAFHDRYISIAYENVTEFSLDGTLISGGSVDIDWIYDEVHLSPSGRVEHVIEFGRFARCLVKIECDDFEYQSQLVDSADVR
jgi:hypothetical protein